MPKGVPGGVGRRFRLQPLARLLPALVAMGSWMERNAGDGQGLVHAVVNRGPRPNDSPDAATRPLRHRRARPVGVVSVTSPGLLPTPSAIRNARLDRARGAGSSRAPLPSVFSFGPKGGRGAPVAYWPMRQAHGSGTRRCSYRFCHRDRSASTRPMPTNLAGPAHTPWRGSARITLVRIGLPRSAERCSYCERLREPALSSQPRRRRYRRKARFRTSSP